MKRIRIVGGTGPSDTKVFDMETGADISHRVRKVMWVHEAGCLPVAIVEFGRPEFEAEAEMIDAG